MQFLQEFHPQGTLRMGTVYSVLSLSQLDLQSGCQQHSSERRSSLQPDPTAERNAQGLGEAGDPRLPWALPKAVTVAAGAGQSEALGKAGDRSRICFVSAHTLQRGTPDACRECVRLPISNKSGEWIVHFISIQSSRETGAMTSGNNLTVLFLAELCQLPNCVPCSAFHTGTCLLCTAFR